ncbi:MAG TPA: LD-carboxypeptidase [candidate division Zixibacteria bacterium]|nr:LD-carboxypeptidase [candidate division Zixibacteria bacterium]
MAVNKPPRLVPGDRIGVVAPAGCVDPDALAAGVEALRREGFEVEVSPRAGEKKGYLAGDGRSRAEELLSYFGRGDIAAIFCARGGFGSIQLLPYLERAAAPAPKIFAGYSDVTILLNWLTERWGMVTFHGPMVAMDLANGLSARSRDFFWGVLRGDTSSWKIRLGEVVRRGKARAELMGGCLSLLVTTLGTPYEIETAGKLLFLEDVGEKPYRVERMLTHLKMAGKLDRPAGVVFGSFTGCDGEGERQIPQIVGELFRDAPYPVVMGLEAGHGKENLTLPFGIPMLLDAETASLSMLEAPVC